MVNPQLKPTKCYILRLYKLQSKNTWYWYNIHSQYQYVLQPDSDQFGSSVGSCCLPEYPCYCRRCKCNIRLRIMYANHSLHIQVDLDRNLCQNVTYAIESKCLDAVESQNYTIRFARWPNAKGRCKKMSRQLTRFTSRPTSSINATIYMQKCKKHTREIKGSLNIAALKWVSISNAV